MSRGALIVRGIALVVLVAFLMTPQSFTWLFAPLTINNAPPIYNQGSLIELALNHLAIVAVATVAATIVAVGLAIFVSRPVGAEFLPLSRSIANLGQTFPPIAVLALAVPVLGFGTAPTLVALFLYGLLPIFENALVGLTTLPATVIDAADGMGMTPLQRLRSVELPLALPVILTAVRIVLVQNIGMATIAALIGGGGFGVFVFAGLGQTAPDLILLGALPTVFLAFVAAIVLDAAVELATGARP